MPVIARLCTSLFIASLSFSAWSETLRIVTEPWAPYVYVEEGQAKGIDYEITALVFARLGIQVQWQFLPWKRCLAMLEQGSADGVLDIFQTHERDSHLLYPKEPLSEVEFVLYQANARPHPLKRFDDLKDLTVGVNPGYIYAEGFGTSAAFKREEAPSIEANFGKLVRGRIDLVITDRRVGSHALRAMGLEDEVSPLPLTVSRQNQYLAVRRNAGMDLLVQRFAAELKRFKREATYTELLHRYASQEVPTQGPAIAGQPISDAQMPNAVEQQDRSAR